MLITIFPYTCMTNYSNKVFNVMAKVITFLYKHDSILKNEVCLETGPFLILLQITRTNVPILLFCSPGGDCSLMTDNYDSLVDG